MRGEKNGRRKDLLDKLSPGFLAFGATSRIERCFVSREKKKKLKEKKVKERNEITGNKEN